MKAYLQSYSLVEIDLVRGRDIWRLTGIHEDLPSLPLVSGSWYPLLEKLASVVYRLCPGEEAHIELHRLTAVTAEAGPAADLVFKLKGRAST